MKIIVSTAGAKVHITACDGTSVPEERAVASGETLHEAIENLIVRFAQLQRAAIEELQRLGFIRGIAVEKPKSEVMS